MSEPRLVVYYDALLRGAPEYMLAYDLQPLEVTHGRKRGTIVRVLTDGDVMYFPLFTVYDVTQHLRRTRAACVVQRWWRRRVRVAALRRRRAARIIAYAALEFLYRPAGAMARRVRASFEAACHVRNATSTTTNSSA